MNQIENYSLIDCVMVDFASDQTLSKIDIITESYYPKVAQTKRKKGLIKISLIDISKLIMNIGDEFTTDILRTYKTNQDDYKANEIYSIKIQQIDRYWQVNLESDFLKINLICKAYLIDQLN